MRSLAFDRLYGLYVFYIHCVLLLLFNILNLSYLKIINIAVLLTTCSLILEIIISDVRGVRGKSTMQGSTAEHHPQQIRRHGYNDQRAVNGGVTGICHHICAILELRKKV